MKGGEMTEKIEQRRGMPRIEGDPEPGSPRIYVASLSDYNNGRLHGCWLDATKGVEHLQAGISEMLSVSLMPGAEEYAVHNYDGFAGLRLGEHESLGTIAAMAQAIKTYGPAFAAWAQSVGIGEASEHDFRSQFLGSWASLDAFGREFARDLGLETYLDAVPARLRRYVHVNTKALVSDMLLNGEIDTLEEGVGVVHVFLAGGPR
jgi:antirestriction protein